MFIYLFNDALVSRMCIQPLSLWCTVNYEKERVSNETVSML